MTVLRFHRAGPHLGSLLLLAITTGQVLFLGGLTSLGLWTDGPAFFLHIMGIRG